jgi:lipoate-protein ligase A
VKTLEHSLPEPAHNMACDEILLDEVNEGRREPVLRFWEARTYFAIVGYGNSIQLECDTEACKRLGIPILRRISGGGAILQGPGCLNYSLVMRITRSGFIAGPDDVSYGLIILKSRRPSP